MGLYVEVPEKDKWIQENGTRFYGKGFDNCPTDHLPVILLHQGFIALGVAYNAKEFLRFLGGRPDGAWYTVPKARLREVTPGAKGMKEFK